MNIFKRVKELEALMALPAVQKAIEHAKLEQEKQKAYDTLVKSPFKYDIIKDFIEAAKHDVVIKFTVDGIPIEIRKDKKEADKTPSPLF